MKAAELQKPEARSPEGTLAADGSPSLSIFSLALPTSLDRLRQYHRCQ